MGVCRSARLHTQAAKFVLAGESSVAVHNLTEVLAALEVGERRKRTVCLGADCVDAPQYVHLQ
jgi:hypothetical protein